MDNLLVRTTGLYRRPRTVLTVALVLTLVFAAGIPFLKFDNNIRNMLPPQNRDLLVHDYYEDEGRFGSSAYVFLGMESADAFSPASLAFTQRLQEQIEALNQSLPAQNTAQLLGLSEDEGGQLVQALRGLGIHEGNYLTDLVPVVRSAQALEEQLGLDPALASKVALAASKADPADLYHRFEEPIAKIENLLNADSIVNRDDSLVVEKLVDGEVTPEAIVALKQKVSGWDIYQGVLVSQDGTMATTILKLNTHDIVVKASLHRALERILLADKAPGITTYLDGESVIEDKIARYMTSDIALLLPLVVVAVLLVLFLCFRNLEGVLYPSLVVLMGVVWAVGLGAWMGIPVTVVGTAMPVLLVAISSAYGIHQMNHYLLDPCADKGTVLVHNMKTVGLAILLSGITVMVGFGALVTSQFTPVKNFGLLTAFGDLVAVAAALFVLPALVLVGKKPKNVAYHEAQKAWSAACSNSL